MGGEGCVPRVLGDYQAEMKRHASLHQIWLASTVGVAMGKSRPRTASGLGDGGLAKLPLQRRPGVLFYVGRMVDILLCERRTNTGTQGGGGLGGRRELVSARVS